MQHAGKPIGQSYLWAIAMVIIEDGCGWVKLDLNGLLPSFMYSYADYLYWKFLII